MKLTCPECFSEFEVPDNALGPSGKRVRCSACAHVWFQEPLQDNTTEEAFAPAPAPEDATEQSFTRFDEGMAFEPIPSSLYPESDEPLSHAPQNWLSSLKAKADKEWLLRLAGGFLVAAACFALFLWVGALVGLHKGVLKGFYAPFGIVYESPAIVLAVEGADAHVSRNAEGEIVTDVTGVIRNTGESKVRVPLMEISIISEAGVQGDASYIKLETETLAPGQAVEFEAQIPSAMRESETLRIRFID